MKNYQSRHQSIAVRNQALQRFRTAWNEIVFYREKKSISSFRSLKISTILFHAVRKRCKSARNFKNFAWFLKFQRKIHSIIHPLVVNGPTRTPILKWIATAVEKSEKRRQMRVSNIEIQNKELYRRLYLPTNRKGRKSREIRKDRWQIQASLSIIRI